MPRVSVIMAHAGSADYVDLAVESLGEQSFRDFELVVVDDVSDVDWGRVLPTARCPTQLVENGTNKGLTASLNIALSSSRGEYVARMDSDDVLLPERLKEQVEFLDAHPGIGIVGTAVEHIDASGKPIRRTYPITERADVSLALGVFNQLAHGSVVMRANVLRELGGYDSRYRYAQDYDLWLRAKDARVGIANLPRVLYKQRLHSSSVSETRSTSQANVVREVLARSDRHLAADVEEFFHQRRDRRRRRPYESLQLGKLALFVELATRRAGSAPWVKLRSHAFLARYAPHTVRAVAMEGSWRSQWRLKTDLIWASLTGRA